MIQSSSEDAPTSDDLGNSSLENFNEAETFKAYPWIYLSEFLTYKKKSNVANFRFVPNSEHGF